MPPEDRDIALLWDMREAAREVLDFMQGVTFARFACEKVLRYAAERQIMAIGEAAKNISENFKRAHPEIPWNGIIA
jgi:uncharacterized protein with HEPN domain